MVSILTRQAATGRMCTLNNRGVVSFQAGETKRAIVYFAETLQTVKGLMVLVETENDGTAANHQLSPSNIRPEFSQNESSRDDSMLHNWRQPLFLDPFLPASPIYFICAVVLLNTALLYHNHGLVTGNSYCVAEAEVLCERCLLALGCDARRLWCRKGNGSWLAALAKNNMAQIAVEKGNVKLAREHLGHTWRRHPIVTSMTFKRRCRSKFGDASYPMSR